MTETGFIKSRHLDDKVSAAILLNLLRIYKEEKIELPVTHFAFSVFEEVGHGANSNIPAQVVEYLAVDMGAMGDDQQTDEYTVSICVKDASGPYHYDFRQHLVSLAKEQDIPFKRTSIHFMVRTLQQLCPQGQKLNTPFSVLVSSLAILMSVPILTRWSQRNVWLMLILRAHW